MPELPEVETTVRDLRRLIIERVIADPGVSFADWPRIIATYSPEVLGQLIAGEKILALRRRAKYILIELSQHKHLVFHRKMTGNLFWREPGATADRYTHLVIPFRDGSELRFTDLRKFGRVYLFLNEEELSQYLAKLGPEPLEDDFTEELFHQLIASRRGMLKPLLLNQGLLVGLGNIYVNEALFVSGLHPKRSAETLKPEERTLLYHAIRQVLTTAIENRGTTLSDYLDGEGQKGRNQELLFIHNREGKPCRNCGTLIIKIMVGQRGTYLCPNCQPKLSLAN
ncbi:MAG: DNA-formamidopyrimidine glycosylase [Chloroflexota bacterium]